MRPNPLLGTKNLERLDCAKKIAVVIDTHTFGFGFMSTIKLARIGKMVKALMLKILHLPKTHKEINKKDNENKSQS